MNKRTAQNKDRRDIYSRRCRRNGEIELAYYSQSSIDHADKRGFFVSHTDAALMRKWLVQRIEINGY